MTFFYNFPGLYMLKKLYVIFKSFKNLCNVSSCFLFLYAFLLSLQDCYTFIYNFPGF